MNYGTAVAETRRHFDLSSRSDYTNLVRYATLAASSHNTQPWKFGLGRKRIQIVPDFARRCPAVDPDDHHLYASLGCATENLLLAARAAGLRAHYSFDPGSSSVLLDLEDAPAARCPLFDAIPQRYCCRAEYDAAELTATQLSALEEAGSGDGVSVILLTGRKDKENIAQYVAEGNTLQFSDRAWARELQHWIRFDAREAVRTGDGLYGPVMGSPDAPRWLGALFMRVAFSARRQNEKDVRRVRSSSAIAVLCSEANVPAYWVAAGRCYERLALQACVMGLRTAFINQPVEVASLRPQLAQYLRIGDRRPDLVVRIGRGPQTPRSLRRPVEEVIV